MNSKGLKPWKRFSTSNSTCFLEIEVKIRDWDSCYHVLKKETSGGGGYVHYQELNKMAEQSLEGVRLDCNYIYLDTEERKRFAQSNHKYMITQTQTLKCGVSQGKTVDLNFNHPVKDIFYYFQNNTRTFESDLCRIFEIFNI